MIVASLHSTEPWLAARLKNLLSILFEEKLQRKTPYIFYISKTLVMKFTNSISDLAPRISGDDDLHNSFCLSLVSYS